MRYNLAGMARREVFDKIDLHLVRVLHTLLIEKSVSRAAIRLGAQQPAVSASLRRLRELTGDDLLVRSGGAMAPTPYALGLLEPAATVLREAERLFSDARGFDAATTTHTFRLAAAEYMDPQFLPRVVAETRRQAPASRFEIRSLSAEFDYARHLRDGEVDLVIGNWLEPPASLHLAELMADEIVCLVSERHPAARRGFTIEQYLAAEHVAPAPWHPGARGVIDQHLERAGLARDITVRCPHFGVLPRMVSDTLLVLTTGRLFCSRYVGRMPVCIVPCPVPFPALRYYQLWHDRTRRSAPDRWLRQLVRDLAARPGGQAGEQPGMQTSAQPGAQAGRPADVQPGAQPAALPAATSHPLEPR